MARGSMVDTPTPPLDDDSESDFDFEKMITSFGKKVLTVQNRAQVHRKPTGDLVPFSPRRVLPRFVNPRIGSKLLGFSI
jgi:hypothetical protein